MANIESVLVVRWGGEGQLLIDERRSAKATIHIFPEPGRPPPPLGQGDFDLIPVIDNCAIYDVLETMIRGEESRNHVMLEMKPAMDSGAWRKNYKPWFLAYSTFLYGVILDNTPSGKVVTNHFVNACSEFRVTPRLMTLDREMYELLGGGKSLSPSAELGFKEFYEIAADYMRDKLDSIIAETEFSGRDSAWTVMTTPMFALWRHLLFGSSYVLTDWNAAMANTAISAVIERFVKLRGGECNPTETLLN